MSGNERTVSRHQVRRYGLVVAFVAVAFVTSIGVTAAMNAPSDIQQVAIFGIISFTLTPLSLGVASALIAISVLVLIYAIIQVLSTFDDAAVE